MTGWFDGFEAGHRDVRHPFGGTRLFTRVGGPPDAPPLLLLHGFPQTHAMWHRVAVRLAGRFRVVLADLRGYGDSWAPASDPEHLVYSKRVMAADLVALMKDLGHERFAVAGHDRGGRVAHRLALDHPAAVSRLAVLDIAPTLAMYEATDLRFARAYYHWFHLIQPEPLPERMIGGDSRFYLHWTLGGWGSAGLTHLEPRALAEYERCFCRPETIHALCEDYRASAGPDLDHDRASQQAGELVRSDLLALTGSLGVVEAFFDWRALWQEQCAGTVIGRTLAAGHFLAEERPDETAEALAEFFGAEPFER
jgi:haloacetate dehalogenase